MMIVSGVEVDVSTKLASGVDGELELSVEAVFVNGVTPPGVLAMETMTELASAVDAEDEATAGLVSDGKRRLVDVSIMLLGELIDEKMKAGAVDDGTPQSWKTVTVVTLWIAEVEASAPHPLAVKVTSTHFFCPTTGVV